MEIDLVDLVEVAAVAADSAVAEAAVAADSVADEVALVQEKCTKQPVRTAGKNAKFLSSPVMVLTEIQDLFTAKTVTRIIRSSNYLVTFLFSFSLPFFADASNFCVSSRRCLNSSIAGKFLMAFSSRIMLLTYSCWVL